MGGVDVFLSGWVGYGWTRGMGGWVDYRNGWMGGLQEWVDGWTRGMGGLIVGGFLPSSLCRSYEVKYMKIEARKTSPRFSFGFSRFAL
jgi:hypothetical protein